MQTQLQRYLHAIDALRKDLHQPENVNRMAQQALANDHVSVRNQLKITTTSKNVILFLHDKKNPFRARGLETIKDIITLLQPSAASEPTTTEIPTINVFEEEENKTHSATSAAKHSAMGTQSPKASSFSKQQKDRRTIPPLSFSSTAETVRYQATPDELTAMHETLDPIKMNMALNQGILVDEPESPLAERMQKGSLAQLNDMPVLPKTK